MSEQVETPEQTVDQGALYDDILGGAPEVNESTVQTGNNSEPVAPQAQPAQGAPVASKTVDEEFGYLNADGSLNVDTFLKDYGKFNPVTGQTQQNGQVKQPELLLPGQQPEQTAQKKSPFDEFYEKTNTYKQTLNQNLTLPMNFIREALKAGYNADQAVQYAQEKITEIAQKHTQEYELEQRKEFEKTLYQEQNDRLELAKLDSQSKTNHASIAREFGVATDRFESILFHKELGLKDIGMLFDLANPGLRSDASVSKDVLQQKLNNWYTKFTSNPDNMRYLAESAMLRLQRAVFPKMAEKIKGMGASAAAGKARANSMQTPGKTSHTPKKPTAHDPFDDYLNGEDARLQ